MRAELKLAQELLENILCELIKLGKKRNHTPPRSNEKLFSAERNRGRRGKILVVDMVFLVFFSGLRVDHRRGRFYRGQKVIQ